MIETIFNVLFNIFIAFLGMNIGYWLCAEKYGLHKKITCIPEKNIHIFDEGKTVCHCMRMMKDGTTFSIPIKAQKP